MTSCQAFFPFCHDASPQPALWVTWDVVMHVDRGGEADEVESMTLDGGTLTIETLLAQQVRETGSRDVPHVRERIAA